MFPTFIGILDIQSWWEVPSIAHFCSLFRDTFNLLDFDIEDLEEALLTDSGTEGHLLQELIVRLLEGCLPDDTRNDISTFNYQMFLRRLFRKKCQEYNCENPFNTDVDFELLPLRQKVEILWALCDFRLDIKDVEESLSDLDSDCLRVEPLGHDRKNSAYWYFYGTRLYREDYIKSSNFISQKQKIRPGDKRHKRRRSRLAKEEEEEKAKEESCIIYRNENKKKESIWQVVCFTLQDWSRLVEKFKDSEYATERKLYKTLSEDFMPEIPKLFDLKEKQQRRKILQRSVRIVENYVSEKTDESIMVKNKIKTKTNKGMKGVNQVSKNVKVELVPPPIQKKGRQTNNSLASAVGQIVIDTCDEVVDVESQKGPGKHGGSISSGYGFTYNLGIEEEEQQIGMHKVLKILKDHENAWPFIDPVDEQYAPRYYSVVRHPMDLSTMEDKLEDGSYKTINQFKRDFRLIVDNCKQYNGSDNEYTEMATNLKDVFDRAVDRYLESEQSSDDSLSIGSDVDVNSLGCKNKTVLPFVVRHSQRHKHLRKLNKKAKFNTKINKKKMRQRIYDDSSKEKSEVEVNVSKVNEKKGRKKIKKCKNKVKADESNAKQINESAISDTNVIKSKKKKKDNEQAHSKNKKITIKDEIKNKIIKINKKIKNEIQLDNEPSSTKELKDNRKRKDDFEDYDSISISKNKSRKVEKKEIKELDGLIDRARKSKIKKKESQVKPIQDNEILSFSSQKGKKKSKIYKEKLESLDKNSDKEKDKKFKEKSAEKLKNGEVKKESGIKNAEIITNTSKIAVKKFESLITNKDIESLDSLKDRISERRREEKFKLEQEKKKKQSLKTDSFYGTSKKVPSNSSTYNHNVDKLGNKKLKCKNLIKEETNSENNSVNVDECEPKKIKIYSKHTKGSGKRDPTIQALNQATEETLNDINKWLDDAPKLCGFSSGTVSPVLHTLSSDLSRPKLSKHSTGATTLTTTVVMTGIATTTDISSRKRLSSMKLFGTYASIRPKKVQRTIDRLQPGKSKGNLLSKKLHLNEIASSSDTIICQSSVDNDQANRELNEEPKLSLGTVLKNVDSIQLICKSLVSSPNPTLSNEDDEESVNKSDILIANTSEEQSLTTKKITGTILNDAKIEKRIDSEEIQKPKSATPNLSAWFKAFGAPKSKKKEEEEETASFSGSVKKEEILENIRQRRISTGGSSVSESVSSFSQESPPSRTGRSPQHNQHSASVLSLPTAIEPQLRGAGFYQDALSTGSSPYNSPYYTTPPRYSAQLPPTPSPQNQPLSPAYSSSTNFEQPSLQVPTPPSLYSQLSPQTSHQSFKTSTQAHSPTFSQVSPQNCFSQNSPQGEAQQPFTVPTIAATSNQSPIYQQQTSPYPQPSPQTQSAAPGYLQPNPQTPASRYSQPSPSQNSSLNFSQSSPQQQHSPYSQSSPQPSSYSQLSPQSQQQSPYSQSSPQQTNFSQVSPRPPSSTYSQSSPQPPGYTAQTPSPYSQSDLVIAQLSPQSRGYSQTSPQQPPNYSQSSPQSSSPYSAQPSPQQQTPSYSQPSPQTPSNYSQPSPQQPRTYSSPQQLSQQSSVSSVQQQQTQTANFSQSLNQQQNQQTLHHPLQAIFIKNSEDFTQNLSTTSFTQPVKSTYFQSSATTSTPIVKPTATKEKQIQLQQENTEQHLVTLNHQIYQSASSSQYPATYSGNVFPTVNRVSNQLVNETSTRSATSRLVNHATQQLGQQRQIQQNQDQQAQLLSFQPNLSSHESLYSTGFQTTPYSISNVACRPVYPGYFDTSTKGTNSTPSSGNSLAPVKKRMYNEPSTVADTSTQRSSGQEQFGFDSLIALAHSQTDVSNQFDSAFANSLADSVVSNPAYARLQLGLVARSTKDTQQLLSIPRGAGKNDTLAKYGRTTTSSQPELDLNLLQSLQNAAVKSSGMLSLSRRNPEQPLSVTKLKKNRKSKQQQQPVNANIEQKANIPSFSQYGGTNSDPIGLKQSSVGGSAFNFTASANATNTSTFYDKEGSASAAAAAYAFLDDFRNPNIPSYYSMALRQQQQQQQQAQQQLQHQQAPPASDVVQQSCNKLSNQTTARSYSGHPFLHSTQRPTPYRPPVPPYVTPHATNLGVDSAAYQQYLHSLYALQPPPHHRPTWL